jgi:hypothetical protein
VGRRKGELPGRFVNAYLRKSRNQPGAYENVAEYQERVEVTPSKLASVDPQGKLDLSVDPRSEADTEDLPAGNKGLDG